MFHLLGFTSQTKPQEVAPFVICKLLVRGKAKKENPYKVPISRGWYLAATLAICFMFGGGVLAGGRW